MCNFVDKRKHPPNQIFLSIKHVRFRKKTIKFQSVKAQISSFERVPVEISKISQLNLGKHTCIDINNFSRTLSKLEILEIWKL